MRERSLVLTKANRQKSRTDDKTQTRRVMRVQPEGAWARHYPNVIDGCYADGECKSDFKAPWQVGDHLWMLEPYQVEQFNVEALYLRGRYLDDRKIFKVNTTDAEMKLWRKRKFPFRKTSSRFMYRSLARYWFEVTGVGCERVQDISEQDALAEGIETHWDGSQMWYKNYLGDCDFCGYDGAVKSYETLWDSINKKRGFGWDKNPWVWPYEYKKITK